MFSRISVTRPKDTPIKLTSEAGEIEGWVTANVDEDYIEDWLGGMSAPGLAASLASQFTCIAVIDTLRVDPDHRRQGAGKAFMRQFIAKAKARHAQAVLLEADGDAEPIEGFDLLAWYGKFGFKKIGREGSSKDVVMILSPI